MSAILELLLSQPTAQDRYMQVMQMLGGRRGGGGGGGMTSTTSGTDASFLNGGSNPWGIDPNGMDLLTRHGVTLDDDAMRSLIAARRAGYNAFPYIGQGYRSIAQSESLYNSRHDANGNLLPGVLPAAPPGQSMHNYGLAFDAGNLPPAVRSYLLQHGWYWGQSFGDAPHYSYERSG